MVKFLLDYLRKIDNKALSIAMLLIATLLEPLAGVPIPADDLKLFIGGVVVVLTTIFIEEGFSNFYNLTREVLEAGYRSRRVWMLALALVYMVLEPLTGIDVARNIIEIIIVILGAYIGLGLGFTDIAKVINPPDTAKG